MKRKGARLLTVTRHQNHLSHRSRVHQLFASYKETRRLMIHSKELIAVSVILLAVVSGAARGQKSSDKQNEAANKKAAIIVLDSVVDEIREVESLEDRVALSAGIVNLLAEKKPERCRQMLDDLFESLLQAKMINPQDNEQSLDFDLIAGRIIAVAARFDRKLAEAYISRYAKLREDNKASSDNSSAQTGKLAADFYLKVATELLERNPSLASITAEKSLLYGVTPDTLLFLARLRKKDASLGDKLSVVALNTIRMRGAADVNELLRLYSYVFSSAQVPFVTIQEVGFEYLPDYGPLTANNSTDSDLSRGYLQVVMQLLLAPERGQRMVAGQLTAGALGDYFLLKTIEPHLAKYFPQLVAPVAAQQLTLVNFLNPAQRNSLVRRIEQWGQSQNQTTDSADNLDALLQEAADATDANQKDRLYFKAIMLALRYRKHENALAFVEKLSATKRNLIKPYIEYSVAEQFIKDKLLDKAEQLAQQNNDVGLRSYLYTLLAQALVKNSRDYGRATEILSEAENLSSKLDNGEKAIALAGIAAVYARYDGTRAVQLLTEVIRTANKVDGFTLDTHIFRHFEFDGFSYFYELYSGEMTVGRLLGQQARRDFNSTFGEVRGIKSRLFRLQATIALCRGILIS